MKYRFYINTDKIIENKQKLCDYFNIPDWQCTPHFGICDGCPMDESYWYAFETFEESIKFYNAFEDLICGTTLEIGG